MKKGNCVSFLFIKNPKKAVPYKFKKSFHCLPNVVSTSLPKKVTASKKTLLSSFVKKILRVCPSVTSPQLEDCPRVEGLVDVNSADVDGEVEAKVDEVVVAEAGGITAVGGAEGEAAGALEGEDQE